MHNMIRWLHGSMVFDRRVGAIARAIAPLMRPGERVLDIGCGSGQLAFRLLEFVKGMDIWGVETFMRPETEIPVLNYDGLRIPFADRVFDVSMLVDVLHHAEDPVAVLREARRVSRRAVVVKDHLRTGAWSHRILSFMDWVGNAPHGVDSKYHYFDTAEWSTMLGQARLDMASRSDHLGLYPWPASLIFERNYHFVAVLEPGPGVAGVRS